jgi:hypothetical protein
MVTLTQRHRYRAVRPHTYDSICIEWVSAQRQRGSAADQRLVTARLLRGGADALVGRQDDRGASTILIARRDGSGRRGQCQGEAAEDEIHVRSGGCPIVGLGDVEGCLIYGADHHSGRLVAGVLGQFRVGYRRQRYDQAPGVDLGLELAQDGGLPGFDRVTASVAWPCGP